MPLYEYYCQPCGTQFDVLRPVSQMDSPAVCPDGHTTNNRVLSLFARVSKSTQGGVAMMDQMPMMGGDACCSTDGDDCSCC